MATRSTGGSVCFAEPCRPAIHSTWKRAKSGTSDQGTPAEVTSLEAVAGALGLASRHKNPSFGLPRRADIRATRFVAELAASPLRETTLPGFGRLARASALLLMQVPNLGPCHLKSSMVLDLISRSEVRNYSSNRYIGLRSLSSRCFADKQATRKPAHERFVAAAVSHAFRIFLSEHSQTPAAYSGFNSAPVRMRSTTSPDVSSCCSRSVNRGSSASAIRSSVVAIASRRKAAIQVRRTVF